MVKKIVTKDISDDVKAVLSLRGNLVSIKVNTYHISETTVVYLRHTEITNDMDLKLKFLGSFEVVNKNDKTRSKKAFNKLMKKLAPLNPTPAFIVEVYKLFNF